MKGKTQLPQPGTTLPGWLWGNQEWKWGLSFPAWQLRVSISSLSWHWRTWLLLKWPVTEVGIQLPCLADMVLWVQLAQPGIPGPGHPLGGQLRKKGPSSLS